MYGAIPSSDRPEAAATDEQSRRGDKARLAIIAGLALSAVAAFGAVRGGSSGASGSTQQALAATETAATKIIPLDQDDVAGFDDKLDDNTVAGFDIASNHSNHTSGWFETEVDLTESVQVQNFLKEMGIDEYTSSSLRLDFIPKITLRLHKERAAGVIGQQATSGYVAFSLRGVGLQSDGHTGYRRSAGYLVVMTMHGELLAARPTERLPTNYEAALSGANGNASALSSEDIGFTNAVYYDAFKPRDPHRMLMGANLLGGLGRGPITLWDWKSDPIDSVNNGTIHVIGGGIASHGTYTSHDLQYVSGSDYDAYIREHVEDSASNVIVKGDVVSAKNEASSAALLSAARASASGDDDDKTQYDRVWRPSCDLNLMYSVDASSGAVEDVVGPLDHARTDDMNHFQIIEGGYAIVNGRMTGSFRKVDIKTGLTVWTCGGAFGDFTIVDLEGKSWPGGADGGSKFFWWGQHNLEYVGEGEFVMFDNAYDAIANDDGGVFIDWNSRPLRVQLDEDAMVANITWAYDTGCQSNIFGDADLLPTGHILTEYWPNKLSTADARQFDTRVAELVPSTLGVVKNESPDRRTLGAAANADDISWANASGYNTPSEQETATLDQVAFELLVHGHECTEAPPTGCSRSGDEDPLGWSMYSVERFYAAPLAHEILITSGGGATVVCRGGDDANSALDESNATRRELAADDGDDSSTLSLSFTAFDSFKRNLPSSGTWAIVDQRDSASVVASGDIAFRPFWRPTAVTASLDITAHRLTSSDSAWQLVVQDEWGYDNRTITLVC